MEKNANTTITVDLEVRGKIEGEKIHKNESLNDVLRKKYGLKVE
jgi:hypothetical protein